jgi:multidrug efflux pump subunit AcrB
MNDRQTEAPHRSAGRTPVEWMSENRVAANLLMIVLIVGGLALSGKIKQEVFPEVTVDAVRISVAYPGASPAEVEQGIILAVEEEVRGLDGVKKVTSVAHEGSGAVTVELLGGANNNKLLQDVKNAVDRITSFPEESERPVVSLMVARNKVVSILVHGNHERTLLRDLGEQIRDALIQDPEITLVEFSGVPPLEIGVEIPNRKLREYNLTLDEVASIIRQTALELPAGGVKSSQGEVLLRTQERRDYAQEFADIPIVSRNDGSEVRLGDLAALADGFADTSEKAYFQGKPAVRLDVYRVGMQTPITVSDAVAVHVAEWNEKLPASVELTLWDDASVYFRGRMNLLLRNAFLGLIMVLLLLGLFLDPRLAFWVTIGIPISILGAFLLIPFLGASINMISLFAFIVTIGIIVDDAIMVGESVYHERQEGVSWARAAAHGARVMTMPVHFAVLTNVVAFLPLFFVPGTTGKFFCQIPAVVVPVLLISLVESLYVLPAHLSHGRRDTWFWKGVGVPQRWFGPLLDRFIQGVFRRQLGFSLRYRYYTLAVGVSILILTVGAIGAGLIKFTFFPKIDTDIVTVQAALPYGAPEERAHEVRRRLLAAAQQTLEEHGGPQMAEGIYSQMGSALGGFGPGPQGGGPGGSHLAAVQIQLVSSEHRNFSGMELSRAWRNNTGDMAGLESLVFDASTGHGAGAPIDVQLSHADRERLEAAARDLSTSLGEYTGVTDLDDGVAEGKPQLSFTLKPEARSLGLTTIDLARQVRACFYGAEALRQQRGRSEVKVLVRLPEEERHRLFTVEELMLQAPGGREIQLSQAADAADGRAYTEISRTDGRRIIAVTADVDENRGNANEILRDVRAHVLPGLQQKYPGLSIAFEGEQREQRETMKALAIGFGLAMFAIYAMLALPFRSYVQPFIVMISIPYGIVGAFIGHALLGYGLSIISMFGIVALAGVVVNDSLVLIVEANRNRDERGMNPLESIREASIRRFRPIILTSLTTFFGLAPMIFETSVQARFIVPMAISLGFGILFSTFVILLLVPCTYMAIEDVKGLGLRLWNFGEKEPGGTINAGETH